MVGIVGYGAKIPRHRIKVEEIAKVWGADAESYKRGLQLTEKSVPAPDVDCVTLSVEATRYALKRAGVTGEEIGALYIGSVSGMPTSMSTGSAKAPRGISTVAFS